MTAASTVPSPDATSTREFDAFVFDMDGTLLHSMPDLADVTNATMRHFGYPEHPYENVVGMVGHGLRSLISQALPDNLTDEEVEEAIAWWKAYYDEHGSVKTKPYDGMLETLAELKARGKKLAVLSNKYDGGVQILTRTYFDGLMDFALGEGPVPRKPDPAGLQLVAKTLGVPMERVAYAGDSDVDANTAKAAGAFGIGAAWGYQPRERLEAAAPDVIIERPEQLLDFA